MAEVCLAVFCRQPRIGVGKQRLAAAVGAVAAYRIAAALWQCVREDLQEWRGDIVLAVADRSETNWAQGEANDLRRAAAQFAADVDVLEQPSGNLGARLQAIDGTLRARGLQRIVCIGSDAPALSVMRLTEIAGALRHNDVALAPAADGGVVAMASRRAWPQLADLPWSTPLLGQALTDRCSAAGMSVFAAQVSFDVDTADDLPAALAALRGDPRPARRALCAEIRAVAPAAAL
jgi:glycosyltransferase A (GT-A) superfamily protein (DUF2064 family)